MVLQQKPEGRQQDGSRELRQRAAPQGLEDEAEGQGRQLHHEAGRQEQPSQAEGAQAEAEEGEERRRVARSRSAMTAALRGGCFCLKVAEHFPAA